MLTEIYSAQSSFHTWQHASFAGGDDDDLLLLAMYLNLEKGQVAYAQHDYEGTISAMKDSIAWRNEFRQAGAGAQEQVLSLSYFRLGDYQAALDWANAALQADPFSPLYQEAVADARRALGGGADPEAGPTAEPSATGEPSSSAGPSPTGDPSEPSQSPGTPPRPANPTGQT
ncbi:MAG: hypothetical protein LBH76_01030 [Propionibacteriaceae bacterium]|nr:hypothetical protein [Propionibacteriaceae bacterium]